MEISIIGGILGLGYYLNKDGIDRSNPNYKIKNKKINKNGNNIYDSKDTVNYKIKEQYEFSKRFNELNNNPDTNLVAKSPYPKFNKIDGTNNKLPIEYNEISNNNFNGIEGFSNYSVFDKVPQEFNKNNNNIDNNKILGVSLTGDLIDTNNFQHNNMTPFFGSKVKQNVDEYATKNILDFHTGDNTAYIKKNEVKFMFKPEMNITSPYGLENFNDQTQDRYYVSNIRNNELPIEQVKVARGINRGYGWEGTGGFHQEDVRDFVMPKSVDELRVKSNPKETYEGRVLPGKLFTGKGEVAPNITKNRPETSFEHGHDRLFKTTGAYIKGPAKSKIILKQAHKKRNKKSKQTFGPPIAVGKKDQIRSAVRKSNKPESKSYGMRNVGNAFWSIFSSAPHDYGKKATVAKVTKRENMANSKRIGNIQSSIHNKNVLPVNPNMRKTRKNTIGNNKWTTNIQRQAPSKQYVMDPNDIARTTIKEQNINNSHNGHINAPNKQYVYNNEEKAKTTIRESMENNEFTGNINAPSNSYVYDTEELAKMTIKQTTEDNNHNGYIQGENKNIVYDPNDIAKTTIKEQYIDNNHNGNLNGINKKHIVYDPNDVMKTTIKETNIDATRIGNVNNKTLHRNTLNKPDKLKTTLKQTVIIKDKYGNINNQTSGGGYELDNTIAVNTNRQFSTKEIIPNPTTNDQSGYIITSEQIEAPKTLREDIADIEYFGNEGPGVEVKPMSYQDIYNSTIKTLREDVSKGRAPTQENVKKPIDSSQIHITTTRSSDYNNKLLNTRELDKNINNLPPDINTLGDMITKKQLPQVSRFDTSINNQLNDNPFHKSIV